MTQQYGLVTEFEAIHLARTPTPIPMVIAIMSEDNGAGDAVDDTWYEETNTDNTGAGAGNRWDDAGVVAKAIKVCEDVGNFTLLACHVADWGISLGNLEAQRRRPQIMLLPNPTTGHAMADANITDAKSTAKAIGAKICTDTDDEVELNAIAWAGLNMVKPADDLQRVRAAVGLWNGPVGDDLPGSLLMAPFQAYVQTRIQLGEDIMNYPLPEITGPGAGSLYSFSQRDNSTAGQTMAEAYLTPIVADRGVYVFWGRDLSDRPVDDAGFQFVYDQIINETLGHFAQYTGRNLAPDFLSVQCGIITSRLNIRRRRGQIRSGVCVPDPQNNTGAQIDANEAYIVLAFERVGYAGLISIRIDANAGSVVAVEGLS